MRTILNFIIKHNHWFLFALLQGVSIMLIASFNNYQGAVFFTSAGGAVGNIYKTLSNIDGYFSLRDENEILTNHNRTLQEEIITLRTQIDEFRAMETDSTANNISIENGFTIHSARVVNNSLNKVNNFITIDKGNADGIKPEMGVICDSGVAGITYTCSNGYTIVLPLLNTKSNISCRINGNTLCSVQWDGKDILYSRIADIPRHSNIQKGDTVVTSGFSSIFPEGIPVGCIEEVMESGDGMFNSARVRLFVDYSSLSTVYIIEGKGHEEQSELENTVNKE